jgi:hypothetical protein
VDAGTGDLVVPDDAVRRPATAPRGATLPFGINAGA